MCILEFILLIFDLITIILLFREIKINKARFNKKIKSNNKILFYKLQKQYLNNSSYDDIEELIIFLNNYLKERKKNK